VQVQILKNRYLNTAQMQVRVPRTTIYEAADDIREKAASALCQDGKMAIWRGYVCGPSKIL